MVSQLQAVEGHQVRHRGVRLQAVGMKTDPAQLAPCPCTVHQNNSLTTGTSIITAAQFLEIMPGAVISSHANHIIVKLHQDLQESACLPTITE
jgi:hypothetical protein